MLKEFIEYHDEAVLLEAYCAYEDNHQKKPGVIIAHDWSGRNDFACRKADKMAELGYVGFALDLYGKGKFGKTKEEKMALMQPFIQDRTLLIKRMRAALSALQKIPAVDHTRLAAIGFCFGGLCVLDLARHGEMNAVISIHGSLQPPETKSTSSIKAHVLALHGFDDPMVKPDSVIAFSDEMTKAKADWQVHIFGNTMHAFTNPDAHDPEFGTVYNPLADERTWQLVKNFLAEIL